MGDAALRVFLGVYCSNKLKQLVMHTQGLLSGSLAKVAMPFLT